MMNSGLVVCDFFWIGSFHKLDKKNLFESIPCPKHVTTIWGALSSGKFLG